MEDIRVEWHQKASIISVGPQRIGKISQVGRTRKTLKDDAEQSNEYV